jgi:hypothetical protein
VAEDSVSSSASFYNYNFGSTLTKYLEELGTWPIGNVFQYYFECFYMAECA